MTCKENAAAPVATTTIASRAATLRLRNLPPIAMWVRLRQPPDSYGFMCSRLKLLFAHRLTRRDLCVKILVADHCEQVLELD